MSTIDTEAAKELVVLYKMFEAIDAMVCMEGGDGEGCIQCENPQRWADLFEQWDALNPHPLWKRSGNAFIGTQDSIIFISNNEHVPAHNITLFKTIFPLLS